MQPTADVVVIGGGVFGCSAALHLAEAGAGRVVLLERSEKLAMQTSSAGAGFVNLWQLGGDPLELAIERYALDFYHDLSAEFAFDYKPVGMVTLAATEAGANGLAALHANIAAKGLSNEAQLLDSKAVQAHVPILDPAHIQGGLWWPHAIRLDAPRAVESIAGRFMAAGGNIETGVRVTGIDLVHGQITGVQTSAGAIATRCVVNAAGAWSGQINALIGLALAMIPLQVARLVTEPLAGVPDNLPLLIFNDYYGVYLRECAGGLLFGTDNHLMHGPQLMRQIGGAFGLTTAPFEPPESIDLLTDDLHRYHEGLAAAMHSIFPVLRQFRVKSRHSGLPVRTPDNRHLLGQAPNVNGYYLIGGDNEVGLTHGPGLARLLAELIVSGQTSSDISAYRPERLRIGTPQIEPATH